MMRILRKIPVFLLLVLVFLAFVVLAARRFGQEEEIVRIKEEKAGFTLLAPKLSHCGDAFFLYNGHGAVMIDTGEKGDADKLLAIMDQEGITALDALILTHYDKDHIGGAAKVLKAAKVKRCYMTLGEEDSKEYEALMDALDKLETEQIYVTGTEIFRALDVEFKIYPPLTYEFEKNADNNRSLMISVDAPGDKLLFCGDAEKERMDQFLGDQYDGRQYTWLKVPHHGRDKGTVKKLLKRFIPKDAVITSSSDEPEEEDVLDLLEEAGTKVWLTRNEDALFHISTDDYSKDPSEEEEGTDRDLDESSSKIEKEEEKGSDSKIAKEDKEENSEGEDVEDDSKTKKSSEEASKEDGTAEGEESEDRVADEEIEESEGAVGKGKKEETKVEAPVFSKESGFYDKAFSLKIKAPKGTRVYYTLDSSVPTKKSSPYTKAIKIEDTSAEPNRYASRLDFQPYSPKKNFPHVTEVVPGFYTRNLIPGPVDKCQVVRAVAVDKEGNRSPVVTASYFVGYQDKEGYEGISMISLVSDPEGFFSDDKGIMVNGTRYKETLASGQLDGKTGLHYLRRFCNTYTGRGKEWEREVYIDFFDEKDQLVFSQEAGIRLHGNMSRVGHSEKSFNLYARKEYDGNDTFLKPFYEDGILQDRVTLMRGNDIKNYYFSKKMNHRAMDTQNYRMTCLFLDGEFWGMYAIQERYNSDEYLKAHYNLNKDEYILAKGTPYGYEIKNGDSEAIHTSFKIIRDYAASHDLSIEENYQKLCKVMDVQSFIDAYAVRIYIGDEDWNWFKNQYLLFYDQKWHWIVFDIDYGASWYNNNKPENDNFTQHRLIKRHSLETDPLFPYLMQNKGFRRQFTNTFLDMGNELFSGQTVRRELSAFVDQYRPVFKKHVSRHPSERFLEDGDNPNYYTGLERDCDKTTSYFEERFPYASVYVKNYFGLTGDLEEITIENAHPERGSVKINTVTPQLDEDGRWTGVYYTDYPVTLTAVPEEGWEFAGWVTDGELANKSDAVTDMEFSEATKVKAKFVKAKDLPQN